MRNSNEQSLREVIASMLRAYKLEDKLYEVELVNSWEKIMGPVVNNHTTQLYVKNKILFAHIDVASLRQELHYNRNKMVELLNTEVGREVIKEVVLR